MERKQEFMPIKEVKEKRRNLEKKFLRYQEAEHVDSIQHKKLFELASKAGAIYRIDGYVLINRDIFNEYLEQFHEPAKKLSAADTPEIPYYYMQLPYQIRSLWYSPDSYGSSLYRFPPHCLPSGSCTVFWPHWRYPSWRTPTSHSPGFHTFPWQ